MLKIEKTVLPSPEQWEIIIEGMRNPMNSWDKMDSTICQGADGFEDCTISITGECPRHDDFHHDVFCVGDNDHNLMTRLAKGGPVHGKFRRMIPVFVTINAPLYWWKEFDTYKVGTVCNSCSTMHKIHSKEFTLNDFSCEKLYPWNENALQHTIDILNHERNIFVNGFVGVPGDGVRIEPGDKRAWEQMIQLLPTSYNQKRTIMLNYEVLVGIYEYRRNHKLDEWHTFCDWIKTLPYSELITGE